MPILPTRTTQLSTPLLSTTSEELQVSQIQSRPKSRTKEACSIASEDPFIKSYIDFNPPLKTAIKMRATYIVPALLALATPLVAIPTPMAQPDGGAPVDANAEFVSQVQAGLAKAGADVAARLVAEVNNGQHKKRTYQSPGVGLNVGAGAAVGVDKGVSVATGTNVGVVVDGILGLVASGGASLGVGKGKEKREPGVDPRGLDLGATVVLCVDTFLGHLGAALQAKV